MCKIIYQQNLEKADFHTLKKDMSTTLLLFHAIEIKLAHEISNNVVCATSKGSDQPAHTRSLIRAFASRRNIL